MSDVQNSTVYARDEIIRQQAEQIRQLQEEIVRLKELLEKKADAKAAKQPKFTENFSLDRNKKQNAKRKNKSNKKRGRKPRRGKLERATQQIDVYPDGAKRDDCVRHRSQFAW